MFKKISISLFAITSLYSAFAQDSLTEKKPALAISGYVDAYYRYNFNNPKKQYGVYNNYTSFTNSQNSFELGMASVKLEHSMGKVGVVADLGFGKRAEEFSYNESKTYLNQDSLSAPLNAQFAIKQAYITYAP